MRKPKRLKIRGDDEKEYPFLVKGGEDLRLDQRIEQLFMVMNQIFRKDSQCRSRNLSIHTYEVVPMTNRVGILEWIDNTQPLKSVLEKELGEDMRRHPAAMVHHKWIQSFKKYFKDKKGGGIENYYAMFKHATREECIKKIKSQHEKVPWDLLRNGITSLSASPESFFTLRMTFARSLAAFSMGSYVIGIGDRHLDNFLLDLSNGQVIGIDFGHAFGTATQILPIPELMPFRLTRQFKNFLLPLDIDGLLKIPMTLALTALHENRDILLNTMDVFVQEPLLDWEHFASRLAVNQGKKAESETWFPEQKINIAKMKLNMYHPSFITLEEVKSSNHVRESYFDSLKDIILGNKKNRRQNTKHFPRCTSVSEQVTFLIDQATDDNILARAWGGWGAYM
eukprot:TRINITY_DN5387_c0_g1_i1.p1 TRINITY_DN5387_c0_g1~~TRINITY_DN5387_c0_g1_i1.p1  ORF type:complete len:406 (+),score=94.50 TRINITY_DN5387_c0_g1_i1:34-1218(+)